MIGYFENQTNSDLRQQLLQLFLFAYQKIIKLHTTLGLCR
jgi:hypothetical protein